VPGLLVDPELVLWDVRIAIVLAEVGELFIHVASDMDPIDDPYLQISYGCILFKIGWLELFCHNRLLNNNLLLQCTQMEIRVFTRIDFRLSEILNKLCMETQRVDHGDVIR
jgi:hypothetical protein